MKIIPLASDSISTRSMATYVQTADLKLTIDPSAALGPKRYGLPPHPLELTALKNVKEEIQSYVSRSDVLSISHYHYDHFDPDGTAYDDKTIYVKDPLVNINKSQNKRGSDFKKTIGGRCTLLSSDDTQHTYGTTTLEFSTPMPHGPDTTRLGTVIMTLVDDGTHRLLHASDVQGPVSARPTEYIIEKQPDTLILDGAPTIFLGWKFSGADLEKAKKNLIRILEETKATVLLDHHLLRDLNYRKHMAEIYDSYGDRLQTFAEYRAIEQTMLEANRKHNWKEHPEDET